MYKSFTIVLILGVGLTWSCATTSPSKSTTTEKDEYSEDLSSYRATPLEKDTVTTEPINSFIVADSTSLPVNKRLDVVLDTAAAYARATIKYIDGFTIQVYAGNDRTVASDFKMDIIRNFPETDPIMVFEQPNYKVRIGQYYTRLEAQQFFAEVKAVFPRAILIPTRIPVP